MKIAVLGGGFAGLTTAYLLAKKNHQVTVYEKEKALGGLAAGFKAEDWNWHMERTYHHLFINDHDILDFAKEIGFNKIFFKEPVTASLFKNFKLKNDNYFTYPLDTPLDLLRFPYLNIVEKLRAGIVIAFLKLSPFLSLYEKQTSEHFLKKTMGEKVWNTLWDQLFRGKYGDYAGNILASFIWARIKKRSKKLGYIDGGFQELIDHLENRLIDLNVIVSKNTEIGEIKKNGVKFTINNTLYDSVVSTLPTPVLTKISKKILPKNYLEKLSKIKYLHALTLILETDRPILNKTYWLNISTNKIPFMVMVQHTNFIDKRNFNNKHLAYIGWYLDGNSKLLKMSGDQLLNYVLPHINKFSDYELHVGKPNTSCQVLLTRHFIFKAPYAQPIFDKDFIKNKPDFITPTKNFFIANLDMTYPYDRGTNYAVKLGKDVAKLI